MATDTRSARSALQALVDGIPAVAEAGRFSREHVRWLQNCVFELRRIFGPKSTPLSSFLMLTWSITSGPRVQWFEIADRHSTDELHREYYLKDLNSAQGLLESAIDQLDRVGLEEVRRESGYVLAAGARKVFISHGHADDVLRRVEDFVRALGLEPTVVKRGPSGGQALDDLVETQMKECEAQ